MHVLKPTVRICSLLFCCFLILLSCEKKKDVEQTVKKEKKKYVAVVNKQKISVVDLENEIRFISHTRMVSKQEMPEIKASKEEKKAFLDEMVNEILMLQEADKLNITISKREIQQEINKVVEAPIEAFKKDLTEVGISYFEWKERLKKNLKIQKLIQLVISNNVVITDEELLEYYNSHTGDFFLPSGAEVHQILLKTEAEANVIHQQVLSKPEKWEDFAKDSIAEDAPENGYMGFFSRGELPEEMDEAIFALDQNKISPVLQTAYGYHIFKVTKKMKARTIPFEEARSKIFQLISAQKAEKHFQAWLNKVQDESTIVIYDEAL